MKNVPHDKGVKPAHACRQLINKGYRIQYIPNKKVRKRKYYSILVKTSGKMD